MKKILIPRKDHEVYFIPLEKNFNSKQVESFAVDELKKIHPGFSSNSSFDLQKIILNDTQWIMLTVMEAEILAEYKIIHKGAFLYTNSSIAVHTKDFLINGINVIDDEFIGFNTETNSPISIPLESDINNPSNSFSRLKNTSLKHGVFNKKPYNLYFPVILASLILMLLIPAAYIIPRDDKDNVPISLLELESDIEIVYLPHALEILENFSSDLVLADVKMLNWHYNDDNDHFLTVQIHGLDALTAYQLSEKHDYFHLLDIKDVIYNNGEPFITMNLNMNRSKYNLITAMEFPLQFFNLEMITNLSNEFQNEGINISSETLPTVDNLFYTIIFSAKDHNLIRSFEIITNYSDKYSLIIKRLDISINSDKNLFTVICVLSQAETVNNYNLGVRKHKIPQAFGYKNVQTSPITILPVIPNSNTQVPILGSIIDGTGQLFFYRDLNEGKIRTRGNI